MAKKHKEKQLFPKIVLDSRNFYIFIGGLFILVIGYVLLSISPWDNPLSQSVAPLVLLYGYLVLFPLAIFLQSSKKDAGSKE